jgi:magnesium transporter
MPELGWTFGYPLALLVMFGLAVAILLFFRRKDWL